MPKINLNKLLFIFGGLALVSSISFFFWWQGDINLEIKNEGNAAEIILNTLEVVSPISGLPCARADRRPLAVMFSSDPIARPLSGISQADMVFEMPVTDGSVTRMMAVYQCEEPSEIGSIRSARDGFISLAAGLGAVYVHWGGEHEALTKLNKKIVNNVDAMIYEGKYFFRKNKPRPPHNGFSDFERLWRAMEDLGYSKNLINSNSLLHDRSLEKTANIANLVDKISIDYSPPHDVLWEYNYQDNLYKRKRNGSAEVDKNTGAQVSASVIIIMRANSTVISKDYMNMIVTGEGEAEIYQGGIKKSGKWQKDPARLDSKLVFYDSGGKEIEFAPGKIWVEVITN